MTCGEAYKQIVTAWQAGRTLQDIAKEMDTTENYIFSILSRYKQRGDDLYKSKRPFKGKVTIPDERQLYNNHLRYEYEQQETAREMAMLRRMIRIGDVVSVHETDGQGFTYQERIKEITVSYIGKYFVVGVNQYGVRETIQIYDLWRAKHGKDKERDNGCF